MYMYCSIAVASVNEWLEVGLNYSHTLLYNNISCPGGMMGGGMTGGGRGRARRKVERSNNLLFVIRFVYNVMYVRVHVHV